MINSVVIRGKNIFLSKLYLQRFYTTEKPKWVLFCEALLDKGYTVLLYLAKGTDSKYITLIKNYKMLKIRYSNHAPNINNYFDSDIKFFVGPSKKGMCNEIEVLDAVEVYFRK